jgi:hypothetical protein
MLLPFVSPVVTQPIAAPSSLEARLDAAVARVRDNRPSAQALRASISLIEELQALLGAEPSRYEAVIAPRSAVLPLWLMQLALVVAAAGLPSQGRALLQALPGVSASAFVHELLAELLVDDDDARISALGGVA